MTLAEQTTFSSLPRRIGIHICSATDILHQNESTVLRKLPFASATAHGNLSLSVSPLPHRYHVHLSIYPLNLPPYHVYKLLDSPPFHRQTESRALSALCLCTHIFALMWPLPCCLMPSYKGLAFASMTKYQCVRWRVLSNNSLMR